MATIKENLEERIERIRRQTEEIEKKHREAEADRLMALHQNAMVKTKQPLNDDDWPKAHKYDKIDFTYDVSPEKLEEDQKLKDEVKSKRAYKKFAEGEGPPPDPIYNFLADDERGDGIRKSDKKNQKDKSFNNNFKNKDQSKRTQQNGNFRGGRPQQQHQKTQQQSSNDQRPSKQNSQIEQWRSNDGRDKTIINGNDSSLSRRSPKHNHTANNNKNYSNGNMHSNNKLNDCLIEKRGNITVSVSQTGEVKSVKLSSAPAIGTGRVGPRQIISKPQFQFIENETMEENSVKVQSQSTVNDSNYEVSLNYRNNNPCKTFLNNYSQQSNQIGSFDAILSKSPIKDKRNHHNNKKKNVSQNIPKSESIFEPINLSSGNEINTNGIIQQSTETDEQLIPEVFAVAKKLSHKPEFKRPSVQDRLLRIRQQKSDNNINDFVDDNSNEDTTNINVVSCN